MRLQKNIENPDIRQSWLRKREHFLKKAVLKCQMLAVEHALPRSSAPRSSARLRAPRARELRPPAALTAATADAQAARVDAQAGTRFAFCRRPAYVCSKSLF